MDWTVWMMFALTEGAVNVSPGPAVLFVVSQSLRYGPTSDRDPRCHFTGDGVRHLRRIRHRCGAGGTVRDATPLRDRHEPD